MLFKHIVLSIDDDDTSNQALNISIDLTKLHHSKLTIIHVKDVMFDKNLAMNSDIKPEKNLSSNDKTFLARIMEFANRNGITPEMRIIPITSSNQRIAFEIVSMANELSADLLVIGAYSRPGSHRLLLGHVAESIIRITEIPVLVIHNKKI